LAKLEWCKIFQQLFNLHFIFKNIINLLQSVAHIDPINQLKKSKWLIIDWLEFVGLEYCQVFLFRSGHLGFFRFFFFTASFLPVSSKQPKIANFKGTGNLISSGHLFITRLLGHFTHIFYISTFCCGSICEHLLFVQYETKT